MPLSARIRSAAPASRSGPLSLATIPRRQACPSRPRGLVRPRCRAPGRRPAQPTIRGGIDQRTGIAAKTPLGRNPGGVGQQLTHAGEHRRPCTRAGSGRISRGPPRRCRTRAGHRRWVGRRSSPRLEGHRRRTAPPARHWAALCGVPPSGRERGHLGVEAVVVGDAPKGVGVVDECHDLHASAAVRAVEGIEAPDAGQQRSPGRGALAPAGRVCGHRVRLGVRGYRGRAGVVRNVRLSRQGTPARACHRGVRAVLAPRPGADNLWPTGGTC